MITIKIQGIENPIDIYSQSDIDHAIRCSYLNLPLDVCNNGELDVFLSAISNLFPSFKKKTIDNYSDYLFNGLSLKFIDQDELWDTSKIQEKLKCLGDLLGFLIGSDKLKGRTNLVGFTGFGFYTVKYAFLNSNLRCCLCASKFQLKIDFYIDK